MAASDLYAFLTAQGYTAFPMQRSAVGHFELAATLDGHDARLLLDTGASMTGLDKGSTDRLGLTQEASSETAGGLGTTTLTVTQTHISTLELGGGNLPSMTAFVVDLSHVNDALAARGADRIDGILGADLLMRYAAVIDYAGAQLYLRVPARTTSSG